MPNKVENTKTRLSYIMNTQNLKQVDILKKCEPFCIKFGVKMNKSDLSQYVSGKVEPSQSKLVILGMALNVSEAWLMGFDVPMERKDNYNPKPNHTLDKQETQLISLYRQLNTEGQDILIDTADTLVSSKKYEKCNTIQTEEHA